MMSRKHFKAIAECIKENTHTTSTGNRLHKVGLVNDLCEFFRVENPNFDRYKFTEACAGEHKADCKHRIPKREVTVRVNENNGLNQIGECQNGSN